MDPDGGDDTFVSFGIEATSTKLNVNILYLNSLMQLGPEKHMNVEFKLADSSKS